jgi:hypothetical protein
MWNVGQDIEGAYEFNVGLLLWTTITSMLSKEHQDRIELFFVSLPAMSQRFAQLYDDAGENLSSFRGNEGTGFFVARDFILKGTEKPSMNS